MELFAQSEFLDVALAQAERMASLDRGEIGDRLGEAMLRQTQDRFDTKIDPEGKPWVALSPKYAARRSGKGSGILRLSGDLLDSLFLSVKDDSDGVSATVGSTLEYAGVHQDPSKASLDRGQKKRSYLGISSEDKTEMVAAVLGYIGEELVA